MSTVYEEINKQELEMPKMVCQDLIKPKSTDKLDKAISEISKISEHDKVGDDYIYKNPTSVSASTMHKIKKTRQVKQINVNALNNAFSNAINEEQSKGFTAFDNTYTGNSA